MYSIKSHYLFAAIVICLFVNGAAAQIKPMTAVVVSSHPGESKEAIVLWEVSDFIRGPRCILSEKPVLSDNELGPMNAGRKQADKYKIGANGVSCEFDPKRSTDLAERFKNSNSTATTKHYLSAVVISGAIGAKPGEFKCYVH